MAKSRVCSISDCGKKHKSRGYCPMHLRRWQKYGSTAKPPRQIPTNKNVGYSVLLALIAEPTTACIEWRSRRDHDGYGTLRLDGKSIRAHRAAYEVSKGSARGLVVRHTCDNRVCVNPNHLILGTHANNVQDCVERGRRAVGRDMPHAKLTEEIVREIRSSDLSAYALSKKFGVGHSTVDRVKRGLKWKHVV